VLPLIVAHRLGRAYGPDSSRAALDRSLEQHVEALETDCCLTADGEVVLLHDPLLELGTTLSGWAHERRAAQVRSGRLRQRDGTPSEEYPLLLDELLELAPPGATLQLEVKAHADPALARRTTRAICDRLAHHPARARTEILSFFTSACELAAEVGFRTRLIIIADYRIDALASWAQAAGCTASASSTSSSLPRWSGPCERPGSASVPAPSTTRRCSRDCCRWGSTPSPATLRQSCGRRLPPPRRSLSLPEARQLVQTDAPAPAESSRGQPRRGRAEPYPSEPARYGHPDRSVLLRTPRCHDGTTTVGRLRDPIDRRDRGNHGRR
jgi:glycerophosphoryl diester phosphodiesterase